MNDTLLGTQVPTHPWLDPGVHTEVAAHYHGEVLPSTWGRVVRRLIPAPAQTTVHSVLGATSERCVQTGGRWHAGLVACMCPGAQLFWIDRGCAAAPLVRAGTAGCEGDWLTCPTRCLRELQAGAMGWHFSFAGQKKLQAVLRQALTDNTWPAMLAAGLTLPDSDSPVTLHLTNRLGGPAASLIGLADTEVVVWPPQYTLAWVGAAKTATGSPHSHAHQVCIRRLADQADVLAELAGELCATVVAAVDHITQSATGAASATAAWPPSFTTLFVAEPADEEMPLSAPLHPSFWLFQQVLPTVHHADLSAPHWRIYGRDGLVLARQMRLEVMHGAAHGWTLDALCDAAGTIQAFKVRPAANDKAPYLLANEAPAGRRTKKTDSSRQHVPLGNSSE